MSKYILLLVLIALFSSFLWSVSYSNELDGLILTGNNSDSNPMEIKEYEGDRDCWHLSGDTCYGIRQYNHEDYGYTYLADTDFYSWNINSGEINWIYTVRAESVGNKGIITANGIEFLYAFYCVKPQTEGCPVSNLMALNAESGHLLWKNEDAGGYSRSGSIPDVLEVNSEFPLLLKHDYKLLTAFDLSNGNALWRYYSSDDISEIHLLPNEYFIYVATRSEIIKLDLMTGNTIWELKDICCLSYVDTIIFNIEGNIGILFTEGWQQDRILAFDRVSGTEIWSYHNSNETETNPMFIFSENIIDYARDPYYQKPVPGKASIYKIEDNMFSLLNPQNGNVILAVKTEERVSSTLRHDNLLFFSCGNVLHAWDSESGEQIWTYNAALRINTIIGVIGNNIYTTAIDEDNNTSVILAINIQNGILSKQSAMKETIFKNERFVKYKDKTFFIGPNIIAHEGIVIAIDNESESVIWSFDFPINPGQDRFSMPNLLLINGGLFINSADMFGSGDVYLLNEANGKVVWKYPGSLGRLETAEDYVYFHTDNKTIYVDSSKVNLNNK